MPVQSLQKTSRGVCAAALDVVNCTITWNFHLCARLRAAFSKPLLSRVRGEYPPPLEITPPGDETSICKLDENYAQAYRKKFYSSYGCDIFLECN